MINLIITFAIILAVLIAFNIWLDMKNGKKWLREL